MSITETAEAGGIVLTCVCHWTRFYPTQVTADAGARDHAKTCKGPKAKSDDKPARRKPAATWSDREGATWIDSL